MEDNFEKNVPTPKNSFLSQDLERMKAERETKEIQYTEEETRYLSNWEKRLTYARDQREQPLEEFDGMTYSQY